MGEPKTPHFYDFGTFERVPEPQNHLFSFLETAGYIKKSKKNPGTCSKNIVFANLKILEIKRFVNFGKDSHRKILKIRLINSWTSWTWDQDPFKIMWIGVCNVLQAFCAQLHKLMLKGPLNQMYMDRDAMVSTHAVECIFTPVILGVIPCPVQLNSTRAPLYKLTGA